MTNSFPLWFNLNAVEPVAYHGYKRNVVHTIAQLAGNELGEEEQEVINLCYKVAAQAGVMNQGRIAESSFELVVKHKGQYVARIFLNVHVGVYSLSLGVEGSYSIVDLVNARQYIVEQEALNG